MEQLSVLNFGDWAGYLFLITLRVLSTFMSSPIFGRNVPSVAKIVLSILIAYMLFSVMGISSPLEFNGVLDYALACLKEIILGALFSLVMFMSFTCVYLAGHSIDVHMGFGFSMLYDSQINNQANITSTFLNVILVILFFAADAHHTMFRLLAQTFTQIPPGTVVLGTEFVNVVIQVFINSFIVALQIAMPILAVSMIIQVLLGVIMKSVPQINYFIIGFPAKIFLGFVVLMIMIPIFAAYSSTLFDNMFTAVQQVFEVIGK